ncbi:MAG: histidine kinase dimerization/phospho-acceptor domain-containing protein, partial [Lentisphaerota bacterium]
MNGVVFLLLITSTVSMLLGSLVFLTNSRRPVNRVFLGLTFQMALWSASVLHVVLSENAAQAEFFIRSAFMITAFIPAVIDLLCRAIMVEENLVKLLRREWVLSGLAVIMAGFCLSDFFIHLVVMPSVLNGLAVPEAVYGPGFSVYVAYFVGACLWVAFRFFKNLGVARGLKRAELQFVLLGFIASTVVGVILTLLIPLFFKTQQASQFGPLTLICLICIIAYGIATRRIMNVTDVLRRVMAYVLGALYLCALYVLAWWTARYLLSSFPPILGFSWPHLLAALVVAFSLAPANGWMQRFTNQLFINQRSMNISAAMEKAGKILQSIAPLDDLLREFTQTVMEAVGTDHVLLLLAEKNMLVQRYPIPDGLGLAMDRREPLVQIVAGSFSPLVADVARHMHPSLLLDEACRKMASLKTALAMGIHSRASLEGVMLLGPRLSGRVYGAAEQDLLRLLSRQLAVAIENSKLYTQLQNGKIYNDILVDHLVSGVVAVDEEGLITVFNREAQRVTGLATAAAIRQPLKRLPDSLSSILEDTLRSGCGARDREIHLQPPDAEVIHLRAGSSLFHKKNGSILGALLVFNDITTLKKLEMQIRRSDRVASLGTLSAGMAHEIKNPLVTIKTFAQLLPERYDDPDFRNTFSPLLVREVKRIDQIVNNLLRFARPSKPALVPTHAHEVLKASLELVRQQLEIRHIRWVYEDHAEWDVMEADAHQLEQAFVNFFMNALQAMRGDGELSVTTCVEEHISVEPGRDPGHGLRISIRDTGEGIAPDNLAHIFDPFFT